MPSKARDEAKRYYETLYTDLLPGQAGKAVATPLTNYFIARQHELLRHYAGQGKIALEIGCGQGRDLAVIGSAYTSSIGLDIARSAMEQIDSEYSLLVEGNVMHLPIVDGKVKFILCSQTLQHVPSISQALHEIYRVLTLAGRVLIIVPNKNASGRIIFRIFTWLGRNLLCIEDGGVELLTGLYIRLFGRSMSKEKQERLKDYAGEGHLAAFSAAEIKELAQKTGFHLSNIHGFIIVPPIQFPFNLFPPLTRALYLFEKLLIKTPFRCLFMNRLVCVLEKQ